jgi:hypothetical protein
MASSPRVIPDNFGVLSFHMSGVDAAGELVNTLGVAVPSSADALDAVNHAANAWSLHVMPVLANSVILTRVNLLVRRGAPLESWDANQDVPTTGGHGASIAPWNCAYLVRKHTAFAGRRNRGRWYLPGVNATGLDGSEVQDSLVVVLQAGVDAFGTAIKDDESVFNAPLLPVILHSDTGAPTEINNFIVQKRLATQRGRLRD